MSSSAGRELDQALVKLGFYLQCLQETKYKPEKVIRLLIDHIQKHRDLHPQFLSLSYVKIRDRLLAFKEVNLLLLLDQLIKWSKTFRKEASADIERIYLEVMQENFHRDEELRLLKIMWRTWTCLFKQQLLRTIKNKVQLRFGIKLEEVAPQDQASLEEMMRSIEPQEPKAEVLLSLINCGESDSEDSGGT